MPAPAPGKRRARAVGSEPRSREAGARIHWPRRAAPDGSGSTPRRTISGVAGPTRSRVAVTALLVLGVLGGLAAIGAAVGSIGPSWLLGAGAVAISTCYAGALAARTGGRPYLFGAVALIVGALAVWWDNDVLRGGAAALTCAMAAVLGVMVTVPAVRFRDAVREVIGALVIAGVGGVAAVGYEPLVRVDRFEYLTLGVALAGAFVLVFRLGAGLHGLGRRGVITVLVGGGTLALLVAYAELLRRYGTPGVVETAGAVADWSRQQLGAFPRPVQALVGVPALVWGTYTRARRRQGWWVCAFGVTATAPATYVLIDPRQSLLEVVLAQSYGLLLGLVLGYALIRLDLALTGPRGVGARRAEEAHAVRPEPRRVAPLL